MNRTFVKTLLAAAAIAAANLAHAQLTSVNTTMVYGGPYKRFEGMVLGAPQGSGALTFSQDLIGALSVAGIKTTIDDPAAGSVTPESIRINAPIASVSGYFTATAPANLGGTTSFVPTMVSTLGGATMTAASANFATTGGQLSVGNIGVDLVSKGIYADITGANGLASQRVRVWDYAGIEGPLSFVQVAGDNTAQNKLTGLTITTQAFELFAQGLGLKAGGRAAMASIQDYGVMTSSLTLDSGPLTPIYLDIQDVPAIPEPSTYMLMGVGLLSLSLAVRRRKALPSH